LQFILTVTVIPTSQLVKSTAITKVVGFGIGDVPGIYETNYIVKSELSYRIINNMSVFNKLYSTSCHAFIIPSTYNKFLSIIRFQSR